jgi:hypothetical protein
MMILFRRISWVFLGQSVLSINQHLGSARKPPGPRSMGPVLLGVSRAIDPIQNKKGYLTNETT